MRSSTRIEIRRLINRFDITTLYVTHDQTEATIMGDRLCVMDKGHVMQVGTYRELYDHPLNTFVAGFLGAPAMNLLDGIVADKCAVVSGAQFPLPQRVLPYLVAGQQVTIGFRPEDVLVNTEAATPPIMHTEIELIERIPSDRVQLIYFIHAGKRLVAKVPLNRTFAPGNTISLGVAADVVHVFNRANGRRI